MCELFEAFTWSEYESDLAKIEENEVDGYLTVDKMEDEKDEEWEVIDECVGDEGDNVSSTKDDTGTNIIFEYLPMPYEAMGNMFCRDRTKDDGSEYYRSSCYKDCLSTFLLDRCNCLPYTHNNTYYCSKFKVASCIMKAIGDYYNQTKLVDKCDCPLPCKYTHYDVSLTSSLFPSDFYSKKIFDVIGVVDLDYYRKNYIALHIYFDQLSTTISKQVPKYASAGDIFAILGGQMGLFLGASIVTLTELCEFLVFALWTLVYNLRNRENRVEKIAIK
ncbi:acid-sensing ion channel 1A-like [Mytilus californianus]|uniref:acid-sensing ion channel 1A-like n=1 Tax=Mytilus californianus TaxID=6549 RepID=UPI0022470285|nr:acid-sensing ion channel 1A-like [Mytilus californianus]